jgi:mRNA interferase MazF
MTPSQGDIVLIPVPFTDLSSRKRRPVVVISNDAYPRATNDCIVVAMTSNPRSTAFSLAVTSTDLIEGQLNRPGRVRTDKIYTLAQSIIIRRFARVPQEFLDEALRLQRQLTAPSARGPRDGSPSQDAGRQEA